MIDLSHKIETAAAPLLRPAQLVKVGQPQPAMLRLAGDLAKRAKSAKVFPSLESELRNAIAQSSGDTLKTRTGQEFPTKIFNQVKTTFLTPFLTCSGVGWKRQTVSGASELEAECASQKYFPGRRAI